MSAFTKASICFFNNKGGVGKTTLACNVASFLARKHGLSILVVDADPQCNATQLILDDARVNALYGKRDATETSVAAESLYDVLAPLNEGESAIRADVKTVTPGDNRFGVHLLPGHPRVAMLEDILSLAWSSFIGGKLEGARRTNWNTDLLASLKQHHDLVFYDVGPSLGALNRTVLVGVDFIVTPMGVDIFSLIGVQNIGDWLSAWQKEYDAAHAHCASSNGAESMKKYRIRADSQHMGRLLGYTAQQYITKTIRGERRATDAYEDILKRLPTTIAQSLGHLTATRLQNNKLRLGDVPHMFSLVPLAQTNHTPIHDLNAGDGLNGGQYAQQKDYASFIQALSESLMNNLRVASPTEAS